MTLFPQARKALDGPGFDENVDIAAERAAKRTEALAMPREEVAAVRDVDLDGVTSRLYVPDHARDGVLLHVHGGGFVFNDIDVHDGLARRFANRSGRTVLSVGYRRPPEHRFPAAPDDVSAALDWAIAAQSSGEISGGPIAVHGDSAGANLALVATLRKPSAVHRLALTYPFLDPSASFDSYVNAADGFGPAEARWYWERYLATPDDETNPDAAPLLSRRLGELPPTLITTAEHDPLRDEGEELARRLAQLDIDVTSTRYQGQVHGFLRHPQVFDAAEPLVAQIAGFINLA